MIFYPLNMMAFSCRDCLRNTNGSSHTPMQNRVYHFTWTNLEQFTFLSNVRCSWLRILEKILHQQENSLVMCAIFMILVPCGCWVQATQICQHNKNIFEKPNVTRLERVRQPQPAHQGSTPAAGGIYLCATDWLAGAHRTSLKQCHWVFVPGWPTCFFPCYAHNGAQLSQFMFQNQLFDNPRKLWIIERYCREACSNFVQNSYEILYNLNMSSCSVGQLLVFGKIIYHHIFIVYCGAFHRHVLSLQHSTIFIQEKWTS